MKKKHSPSQKKVSLRGVFLLNLLFAALPLALDIGVTSFLTAQYQATQQAGYLIALIVFFVVFLTGYVFFLLYLIRKLRGLLIDGLYQIGADNYKKLNAGSGDLEQYPGTSIREFDELNQEIAKLRSTYANSTFVFGELDYSRFPLAKDETFPEAVDFDSFVGDLANIIAASVSFRNAIVEIYFDLDGKAIENADISRIIKVLQERFLSYQGALILLPKDHGSIYLYLPRIDSFSAIVDRFDSLVGTIAVGKMTQHGFKPVPMHYSIVCYPFSAVRELIPDLSYARRQNKLANLYLPNRPHRPVEEAFGKSSMYFNQMSRILYNISSIIVTAGDEDNVREQVVAALSTVNLELGFAASGIVSFDAGTNGFLVKAHTGPTSLWAQGSRIETNLVNAVRECVDPNGAFYFSCRDHIPYALGRYADKLGFSSGYLYLLRKAGTPSGFIYFINTEGQSNLDSYLQEALNAACHQLASLYEMGDIVEDMHAANGRFDALLAHNDAMVYRIDTRSHELLYLSKGIDRLYPDSSLGQRCYKTFYGLEAPCKDCPLASGSKKRAKSGETIFETSLGLDLQRGASATLLIAPLASEEAGGDRHDRDLLVHSFLVLTEQIANQYRVSNNGYLLLLRVDNFADLLNQFGSEGILQILRTFAGALKKVNRGAEEVYRFDQQTLGLVLPVAGQVDLINVCEEIYRNSKNLVFEGENRYSLNITYLSMNFPQGYAGAGDFLRHVYRDYSTRKYDFGKDLIYFDDSDYVRQASRNAFMLSVIDEQFGNETFHINLQPIVHAADRKIFAAELLLRITDEVRHIVFNPGELVRVATEHGKISLISRALLHYVASFFSSVGEGALKSYGFSRMSINTDVSFFTDPTFEESFNSFREEAKLPNGFVAFEIAERDLYDHLDDFKAASKMLQRLHIDLIVDQYSGRYLPLDDVRQLGFKQIKIGRNMVHGIDTDQAKYNDIAMLLHQSMESGFSAAVVGVENIDQYNLLRELDPKMEMQGFYFYAPLERAALLDTLRHR